MRDCFFFFFVFFFYSFLFFYPVRKWWSPSLSSFFSSFFDVLVPDEPVISHRRGIFTVQATYSGMAYFDSGVLWFLQGKKNQPLMQRGVSARWWELILLLFQGRWMYIFVVLVRKELSNELTNHKKT